VISASIASAATTTIDIICNVLKILGTHEVRFYSRRVRPSAYSANAETGFAVRKPAS
jgi:hypothetical protein